MKNVKNNARLTRSGSAASTEYLADLTKCSTIIILVKEVTIIKIEGAKVITVKTIRICKVDDRLFILICTKGKFKGLMCRYIITFLNLFSVSSVVMVSPIFAADTSFTLDRTPL